MFVGIAGENTTLAHLDIKLIPSKALFKDFYSINFVSPKFQNKLEGSKYFLNCLKYDKMLKKSS